MYILVKCYIEFCTLTRTKMDSKKKKKKNLHAALPRFGLGLA